MILAKIRVNGVQALPVDAKHIPKGIIGGQIAFEYTDHMWDGLTKTVVFQGAVTKDVVNAGDLVTIPPEVVQRAVPSLHVGVYGTDAENNIAIPTLWADLGRIRAAADPSGDESTDESLPVWAQLQKQIDGLKGNGTGGRITINGEGPDEHGNFIINALNDVEIAQLDATLIGGTK